MKYKIFAIAAADIDGVIGINNQLPWKLPEDLKRFSALTSGHTVVMGRKTYQSLPGSFRPLSGRKNIVISRSTSRQALLLPKEVELWKDPDLFLESCKLGVTKLPSDTIWIIGGAELYASTMQLWDEVFLTRLESKHEGDKYFPKFADNFSLIDTEQHSGYQFMHYRRNPSK